MSSVVNFVVDFFRAAPPVQACENSEKSGGEHVHDYLQTMDGAWDCSRIVDLVSTYVMHSPSFGDRCRLGAGSVREVAALTGSALSVPLLLDNVYTWTVSGAALFDGASNTAQAIKKFFVQTSNLGNAATQAVTFLHDAKLVNVAKEMPVISCVFNATALFSDGLECIEHVCGLGEDPVGALLNIVKCVASVALAIIGLGFFLAGSPIAATVVLTLSAIWLTAKISSYFYAKCASSQVNLSFN